MRLMTYIQCNLFIKNENKSLRFIQLQTEACQKIFRDATLSTNAGV